MWAADLFLIPSEPWQEEKTPTKCVQWQYPLVAFFLLPYFCSEFAAYLFHDHLFWIVSHAERQEHNPSCSVMPVTSTLHLQQISLQAELWSMSNFRHLASDTIENKKLGDDKCSGLGTSHKLTYLEIISTFPKSHALKEFKGLPPQIKQTNNKDQKSPHFLVFKLSNQTKTKTNTKTHSMNKHQLMNKEVQILKKQYLAFAIN